MKKLLCVALALGMAVGCVAGCGNKAAKKAGGTVKIGFIAPLTGGNAALGIGMKNSAELAVKQANAAGKYKNKYELVVVDDGGDPSTAVSAANKLIADKNIVAVFGHFNSGAALATVPVFHKNGMPLLVTAAIHPDITKGKYKEITRIMTPANVQNEFAGTTATKEWELRLLL